MEEKIAIKLKEKLRKFRSLLVRVQTISGRDTVFNRVNHLHIFSELYLKYSLLLIEWPQSHWVSQLICFSAFPFLWRSLEEIVLNTLHTNLPQTNAQRFLFSSQDIVQNQVGQCIWIKYILFLYNTVVRLLQKIELMNFPLFYLLNLTFSSDCCSVNTFKPPILKREKQTFIKMTAIYNSCKLWSHIMPRCFLTVLCECKFYVA